jgi:hypothetical protein
VTVDVEVEGVNGRAANAGFFRATFFEAPYPRQEGFVQPCTVRQWETPIPVVRPDKAELLERRRGRLRVPCEDVHEYQVSYSCGELVESKGKTLLNIMYRKIVQPLGSVYLW